MNTEDGQRLQPAGTRASGTGQLSIERRVRSDPTQTWRILTTPRILQTWFSPSPEHHVRIQAFDLRIGGSYRVEMTGPDGKVDLLAGTFLEVVPLRRLAMTWAGLGQDGSALVFEIAKFVGGTRVILRQHGVDVDHIDDQRNFWVNTMRRMPSHAG